MNFVHEFSSVIQNISVTPDNAIIVRILNDSYILKNVESVPEMIRNSHDKIVVMTKKELVLLERPHTSDPLPWGWTQRLPMTAVYIFFTETNKYFLEFILGGVTCTIVTPENNIIIGLTNGHIAMIELRDTSNSIIYARGHSIKYIAIKDDVYINGILMLTDKYTIAWSYVAGTIYVTDMSMTQHTLCHSFVTQVIKLYDGCLASCAMDIRIWTIDIDAKCESLVRTLSGHRDEITGIAEPFRNRLISCSMDKTIRVYDLTRPLGDECISVIREVCPVSNLVKIDGLGMLAYSVMRKIVITDIFNRLSIVMNHDTILIFMSIAEKFEIHAHISKDLLDVRVSGSSI